MYYNGVLLDDSKLLGITIIMTFILIVFVSALAVYFIFIRNMSATSEKKEAKRIKRLENDAKDKPELQKQLNKLKRKRSNRNKREGKSIWLDILIAVIATVAICLNLFLAVIPGWTDYTLKDYVVYTGSYETVHSSTGGYYGIVRRGNTFYTVLPDGTRIDGASHSGTNYGTVIYSKRSLILIDIIE
jgi:hypothetical protein